MTTDDEENAEKRDITAPPDGKTHEATTPPGTGDTDEAAMKIAAENAEKAGAGH